MEWGILLFTVLGLVLGGIVLQATYAARSWRTAIAAGDMDVLREAVMNATEGWQRQKPPKGMPPADWQALTSVAVVALDTKRCRVSMLVTPDIRVVKNQREEFGTPLDVGRRVAVKMVERLLYEIPHVRFDEVQVDVYNSYVTPSGQPQSDCILAVRTDRYEASIAPWDAASDAEILREWDAREAAPGEALDPELDALIAPEGQAAVQAAEETLRRSSR